MVKDKMASKLLAIYTLWWGILLVLSTFNPYNIYAVSSSIYYYLILSVGCFSVGFIFNEISSKPVETTFTSNNFLLISNDYGKLAKNKLFIALLVCFLVIVFRYFTKYQSAIALYGAEDARMIRFYTGDLFSNVYEIFLYNFFVECVANIASIYIAFSLVWLRFNLAFFLAVLFAYLFSSVGAGRFYIIELGFFILFFYIIRNFFLTSKNASFNKDFVKMRRTRKRALSIIVPVAILLYGFSIYLSNFRRGVFELSLKNLIDGNAKFFEQIVVYCVGSFRALEYGIKYYSLDIGTMYGRISFGGIDEIIAAGLNFMGVRYEYANAEYGESVVKVINIGSSQEYNGLFTNVFGMYLDFDIPGIIFFSILWGLCYSKIIRYFKRKPNLFSLSIVVFVSVVLILSPLKWKMQSPSSWLFLGGLLMLIRYRKLNTARN